jgi:hypothetical protein
MAKERVQVQGLGDAVPGIQPTIQRGGQYAVQVQRAGRNKLMDLADSLSQINPLLEQYAGVAEQEAQMFEEELSRKSPEEVQAMLKKTEGELDKQVRRGAMGWLTSPLNQKRKLRAVGRAASRALMVDITTRLENPLADDPDDGFELASMLQQEYISNNPALANSVFAQEGLQEAINPQVQQLVVNFERKKAAIAKRESGLAVTSNFFDTIETLLSSEDYQEGSIQSGVYKDKLKEIWAESNAHTPDEQRAIFKATLSELAKQGMKNEAEELLIFAQQELKFGNAPMSEVEQNNYEDFIEDVAEKAEKDLEQDQLDKLQLREAEAYNALYDIRSGKEGEFNGQPVFTEGDLEKAVNNYVELDPENTATLRKNFLSNLNNFRKPSERRMEQAVFNINRDILEAEFDTATVVDSMSELLRVEFPDVASIIESNPQYIEQGAFEVLDQIRDIAEGLSLEHDNVFDLQKALRPTVKKLVKEKKIEIREEYRELAAKSKETKELVDNNISNASNKKVIEPSWWDNIVDPQGRFAGSSSNKYKVEQLKNLVGVSFNAQADATESQKAYNILNELDLTSLIEIANGRKPMVKDQYPDRKKPSSINIPLAKSIAYTPFIHQTSFSLKERKASVKESNEIKALVRQAIIFRGGYMNVQSLESENDPLVGKFDPKLLDHTLIPILTKEEIDAGVDSDMVKRKANAIGKGDDIAAFVAAQKLLYKQYQTNNKTYPNPKFTTSDRPAGYVSQFGF